MAELIGADRTFAKPFRLEEILTAVRELTEKTT
jgi:DNA-binding response OmpR family regulator